MFKIDKGIPIPSRMKYPFHMMRVGDSFHVKFRTPNMRMVSKITSAASSYGRKHGHKYVSKADKDGLRVWRAG